jgi:hypothetical protein
MDTRAWAKLASLFVAVESGLLFVVVAPLPCTANQNAG